MEGCSLLSNRQMVARLLLSCQLAKKERDGEGEREKGRKKREMNLSSTFSSPLSTSHSLLLPAPLHFSQPAINLSVRVSVFVAHPSQVTIFHLHFVSFFWMCASISLSISPSPCSSLHSAPGGSSPAKFGCMQQRERERGREGKMGEREKLEDVRSCGTGILLLNS